MHREGRRTCCPEARCTLTVQTYGFWQNLRQDPTFKLEDYMGAQAESTKLSQQQQQQQQLLSHRMSATA